MLNAAARDEGLAGLGCVAFSSLWSSVFFFVVLAFRNFGVSFFTLLVRAFARSMFGTVV